MRSENSLSVIYRILSKHSMLYNQKEVEKTFFSDPNYPSLLSLINTLSACNLKCTPYHTTIDILLNQKNHCLVYLVLHDKEIFASIENKNAQTVTYYDGKIKNITLDAFEKSWNGIMVLIENYDSKTSFHSHFFRKKSIYLLILIALVMLFSFFKAKYDLVPAIIPTLSSIGWMVAIYMMRLETDKNLYSGFCQINSRLDCRSAIHSPISKILRFISLAEVNFLFFSILTISCLIAGDSFLTICSLGAFLSVCSFPFLLFLAIYQAFIIKRWCIFCLITTSIYLLIGGGFFFIYPYASEIIHTQMHIFTFIFSSCLSLIFLMTTRNYLHKEMESRNYEINLLSLKRDPVVLGRLLCDENSTINIDTDKGFILGTLDAPFSITTVLSPYCQYCGTVSKEMFQLLDSHFDQVRWNIFFDGVPDSIVSPFNKKQLMWGELYLKDKDLFAHHFRKSINQQSLSLKEIEISEQTKKYFKNQVNELHKNQIKKIPTILINGSILSKHYQIKDLCYILTDISQMTEL